MAYIGNPLQTATFLTDTFNGDNSTVAYTLQEAITKIEDLETRLQTLEG